MALEKILPLFDFLQKKGVLPLERFPDALDAFLHMRENTQTGSHVDLARASVQMFPERPDDAINVALSEWSLQVAQAAVADIQARVTCDVRMNNSGGIAPARLTVSLRNERTDWGNNGVNEPDTETPSVATGAYAAATIARNLALLSVTRLVPADEFQPAVIAAKNIAYSLVKGENERYPLSRYGDKWKDEMADGIRKMAGYLPNEMKDNFGLPISREEFIDARMKDIDHALELQRQRSKQAGQER